MLRALVLLLFCSNLLAINVSKKVAVIGAGAAGLAAAQRLKASGFQVVIYESSNRVGGKCFTVPCKEGSGIVELGAIQVGLGYSLVNEYRKAVGMRLRNYWPSKALYFDHSADTNKPIYKTLSEDLWPAKDFRAIWREASTMSAALKRFQNINESHFTQIPENSEFDQPFEDWATGLSLDHFKREYSIWMTAYGYGRLREVPTFLALSLLNSSYGLIAMRKANMNLRMLDEGYGGLLNAMIKHYKLDVRRGAYINSIDRSNNVVTINSETNGFGTIEEYGHLVVASGIESIPSLFGEKATKEERSLVGDIRHNPYDVVIAYVPGLPKGGYVLPQFFDSLGHVVLISKNSSGGEEAILYIPRAGYQRPTYKELSEIAERDMKAFGFDKVKILRAVHWDKYFPHFGHSSSYKVLNDIQGRNQTIFVGGMARFEIVERAMEHAHDMADEHIIKSAAKTKGPGAMEPIKEYLSANSKEL